MLANVLEMMPQPLLPLFLAKKYGESVSEQKRIEYEGEGFLVVRPALSHGNHMQPSNLNW